MNPSRMIAMQQPTTYLVTLVLLDLSLDRQLSDDFCRAHFLVGLLLQEVKQALNVIKDVRKVAIATLRNTLAKHCFDARYQGKV